MDTLEILNSKTKTNIEYKNDKILLNKKIKTRVTVAEAQGRFIVSEQAIRELNAKAEEKEAKNQNMKLIWTSDCPKGLPSTNNSNLCKKRIYADDSIDLKKLKWEEVEDIAKISYDWKQRFKVKIKK